MIVALVIGHEKDKPGACNEDFVICEYEFNKKLTCAVQEHLAETTDFCVMRVFRRTDYSNLPNEINELNPDLILSFHANAFNKEVSGTEVIYFHNSVKGKKCSEVIQNKILKALGLRDRGVIGRSRLQAGGHLLSNTRGVCLILEPFFIDNNCDYLTAQANLSKLALAISSGIEDCKNIIFNN